MEKIVKRDRRQDHKHHHEIQSSISRKRHQGTEDVRPYTKPQIHKNKKSGRGQTQPMGWRIFNGYGLGTGDEVSITQTDKRSREKQHESIDRLTE